MATTRSTNLGDFLKDAGWRQSTIFKPPSGTELPYKLAENQWLVVCTQSCSVVSPNLNREPHIEVLVATELSKLNPRCHEAKGKSVKELHISLAGQENCVGLACNINTRFTIPRDNFRKFAFSKDISTTRADAQKFAGWLSRYYFRAALPSELMVRAKKTLFPKLQEIWETPNSDGKPNGELIDGIYMSWDPDAEITDADGPYLISLLILCRDEELASNIDEQLDQRLDEFKLPEGKDGIRVQVFNAKARASTFVAELDGFQRLSEWDYLSELFDVAVQNTQTAS